MLPTAIFWPMIAHAVLVLIVYLTVGIRRRNAVLSGEAKQSVFRERNAEPASSASAVNNLSNQFELPVLFHVVCLALFVTSGVSYVVVALAWLFVLSRYVHAYLHMGANLIRHRSPAFAVGVLLLVILWVWFALHIGGAV